MKFTLVIHAAPEADGARSALLFARAAVDAGHELYRVFFYGQGVHNATTLSVIPQDEKDIGEDWKQFIDEQQLDAVVCIAAGLRRGIIDGSEANRYDKSGYNMSSTFALSGLGQLLEAAVRCDRVVTFGD